MSSPAQSLSSDIALGEDYAAIDRFLRSRLLARLAQLRGGTLTVHDALGSQRIGDDNGPDPLHVNLRVHSPGFYRAAAGNGSVGAGESYMAGEWQCDDLVGLVRLLVRNRDLLGCLVAANAADLDFIPGLLTADGGGLIIRSRAVF